MSEEYREFLERIYQAAEAGCVAENVQTNLALKALEQIRKDIVRRVGRPLLRRRVLLRIGVQEHMLRRGRGRVLQRLRP